MVWFTGIDRVRDLRTFQPVRRRGRGGPDQNRCSRQRTDGPRVVRALVAAVRCSSLNSGFIYTRIFLAASKERTSSVATANSNNTTEQV